MDKDLLKYRSDFAKMILKKQKRNLIAKMILEKQKRNLIAVVFDNRGSIEMTFLIYPKESIIHALNRLGKRLERKDISWTKLACNNVEIYKESI